MARTGQRLDKYTIGPVIGIGGIAAVYAVVSLQSESDGCRQSSTPVLTQTRPRKRPPEGGRPQLFAVHPPSPIALRPTPPESP